MARLQQHSAGKRKLYDPFKGTSQYLKDDRERRRKKAGGKFVRRNNSLFVNPFNQSYNLD